MPDQPKYHPRARMEKAIKDGGGVMFHPTGAGGMTETRVITRIEDLPSEADLAGDDETKRAAARQDTLARIAALNAELAKLESAPKAEGGDPSTSPAAPSTATPPAGDMDDLETKLKRLHADELKALCDQHGCPHGTKAEMAAALAAKGVQPPE